MVVLEACGGRDDTVCTGCMKYFRSEVCTNGEYYSKHQQAQMH